jgi:nicotinamide riboside transporter PnuC
MILALDDKVKTQWTIAAIMNTDSSLFVHWETLERVLATISSCMVTKYTDIYTTFILPNI